jgi:23S rRNA (guanosine2251-2'-O)-methyltransferase
MQVLPRLASGKAARVRDGSMVGASCLIMRPARPTRHTESPARERPAVSVPDSRPAGSSLLAGIHPVREALRAGRALDKVLIAKGSAGPRIQEIVDLCRALQVPVRFELREALDRASKGVTHQGVVAFGAAHKYADLDSVARDARLLVVLDGVEDPHNLGAVVRTAHAVGADAVVVGERRSAPLTETVSRAAAGALEHLPVARVTNISRALEELKQAGFWIYGLDERGDTPYDKVDFAERTVLVLGAEGAGLHENVKKHCDLLLHIPMAGAVSSLNVSVAAGVVLFEWRKPRNP